MGTATVGRKKMKPADPTRKPVAVTIKGSPDWREWIEEAAKHCRMSVSGLVDYAVTQFVKQQGFPRKPPER